MSKYLVVVESPAKAKTIIKYLGKDYNVIASMGHLRDLPEKTMGVDIENGFVPKYQTIKGKSQLIKELKTEAKNSERVFLATDPDREGEAISWHIANILNISPDDPCRVTFNEITKNAVTTSIKNPRIVDKDLVDAQQARRILDRIVGYKLSPLLWKKIKKGLSAGRVQSVATRIICDRENEINDFKAKEYWTVTVDYETETKEKFSARLANYKNKKLTLSNETEAEAAVSYLKTAEHEIESVKKSKKTKLAYPPFITSTLQQEASRKLGFTSKRTMVAAQMLYEGVKIGNTVTGLITYMRTDSLRISEEAMAAAKGYIVNRFGEKYAPKGYNIYKSKKNNVQDAHEAIRPTDITLEPDAIKSSLTTDQYKLYKLIWERFTASQMAAQILDVVNVDVKAGDYTLKVSGSTVLFDGYTKLYDEGTDDEGEDELNSQKLPELKEKQKVEYKEIGKKQNFTSPPSRFTEASLIKIMEEYGIGRPSTYAPTITTILSREYVIKEGKHLVPTELGMVITEMMKKNFPDIVDIKFTANMEEKLDVIEEGNIDWVKILEDFYKDFAVDLEKASEIEKVKIADEVTDEICEKCGRNMVIKSGRFGKFLACPGYPECKNAKPITSEVKGVACPLCGSKILEKKSKKGKKYFGCEKNPECGFMSWDEPVNQKCDICGSIMLKKYFGRGSKLYCSNQECENTYKSKPQKDKK